MAKLQHTSPTLGDCIVNDDNSVTVDGQPAPNAVVSEYNGKIRVDVDGNGIINANPVPDLGQVRVTREPGWQGALGYRVVLMDWDEFSTPNAIALAVYANPDGHDYLYTTGAMLWDPDAGEAGEWYVTCPAGQEPGQNDIHMGFLYGSLNISAFTMRAEWDEQTFIGGGDWAAAQLVDADGDGNYDTPVGTAQTNTGDVVITEDNDSINIDIDGDGDADLIIPKEDN